MDVEINEIRSTISSDDSSLVITFAFKFSFFSEGAAMRCYWGRVLWRCAVNLRESYPCRDVISTKSQSSFDKIALWRGCSPVGLLCIFGAPFPENASGGLLLLFFVLV